MAVTQDTGVGKVAAARSTGDGVRGERIDGTTSETVADVLAHHRVGTLGVTVGDGLHDRPVLGGDPRPVVG